MKLTKLIKIFPLYARSIRYLRPRQIAYFILRRGLNFAAIEEAKTKITLRPGAGMVTPLRGDIFSATEDEYCFLNRSKFFVGGRIDWASLEMPKLWRYNLHYFDFILDVNRSLDGKINLVSSWIENNPPGAGDGWEPYTVSLRIVNWIKLFLQPEFQQHIRKKWLSSLFHQVTWLERNIEYHILANHYLKNGKTLFFAGMYFDGMHAERWLKLGLKILVEESHEQILPDGGHFEKSPMYHSIVMEDYLDVLNLILSSKKSLRPEFVGLFKSKAAEGMDYLNTILMPDGNIPLFNDSAFGIAHAPDKLFKYAGRVMGYVSPRREDVLAVSQLNPSGYYIIRQAHDMMIVDCGTVGPEYQPGHAHCDTLSYELSLNGRRVIVDSGVTNYEKSHERDYARSTKAHNTVSVDGAEQSEVWGVFRVARRAYPLGSSLALTEKHCAKFEGAHDGFNRLPGKVVHRRTIEYDAAVGWTICDTLEGSGIHSMESYIHLHPDFCAEVSGNLIAVKSEGGKPVMTIEVVGATILLEKGWYFPAFGASYDNPLIVLSCKGRLPLKLKYCIRKQWLK